MNPKNESIQKLRIGGVKTKKWKLIRKIPVFKKPNRDCDNQECDHREYINMKL